MNQDLIAKARDCLRIHSIALRESRLTMQEGFSPNAKVQEWGLQSKIGLKSVTTGTRFDEGTKATVRFVRGFVEAGLRLVSVAPGAEKGADDQKDDGSNVAAELVATFLAEYDLEPGKDVAADAANEFLKHNAVFHVWTYWREYVQSTFARAMLPHITLPMMVVTPADAKASSAAKAP